MLRSAQSALPSWTLRWLVLLSLWLVLVDSAKVAELATGAVAAAIAATAGQMAMPPRSARARPRAAWVLSAWRPLLRWPLQTALVLGVILRSLAGGPRPRGRFRAVRFSSAPSGPRSRGRRVVVEWLGSLTPNRYVIGIDPERDYLLAHELVALDDPVDPLEPR